MSKPPKTAFVFAGGGSLGAIQVGALAELVRAGIEPDFVVGASVGALNACFFAAAPSLDGVAALESVWRALRRQDVFPLTLRSALGVFGEGGSLFESQGLRRLIERRLPLNNLEDARLPVSVVATNLNGDLITFSSGAAVDALLASAAIPIAFPAVRIGSECLMDAAIAGNTPLITAVNMGAERIFVLQTGYACALSQPPRGPIAPGFHALTLLIANQMARDLLLVEGKAAVHVTPQLCPLDVSPFNFDHSSRLIERAREATCAWIASGGLDTPSTLASIRHRH